MSQVVPHSFLDRLAGVQLCARSGSVRGCSHLAAAAGAAIVIAMVLCSAPPPVQLLAMRFMQLNGGLFVSDASAVLRKT